jgi:hypothetical protein
MDTETEEKSSTHTVWNAVGAERTSRHNVTENSTEVLVHHAEGLVDPNWQN